MKLPRLFLIISFITLTAILVIGQQQQQQQQQPAREANQKICKVTFNPREYKGTYYLNNDRDKPLIGLQDESLTVTDASTYHFIEFGGSGYTDSIIYFSISNDCKVSSYSKLNLNKLGVVFWGNVITFKNVQIEVDPQEYGGDYTMKGFRGISTSRSNTVFTVVPNVGNFLEVNGLGYAGAVVYFKVEESGFITVDDGKLFPERNSSQSAWVECKPQFPPKSCNKLTLKNIELKVDPTTYKGVYQMGTVRSYKGVQNLIVVPNLVIPMTIVENKGEIPKPENVTIELTDLDGVKHKFILTVPKIK